MFRFNEFCSLVFLAIVLIFFTSTNAIYCLFVCSVAWTLFIFVLCWSLFSFVVLCCLLFCCILFSFLSWSSPSFSFYVSGWVVQLHRVSLTLPPIRFISRCWAFFFFTQPLQDKIRCRNPECRCTLSEMLESWKTWEFIRYKMECKMRLIPQPAASANAHPTGHGIKIIICI